jgi:hypothetical protein
MTGGGDGISSGIIDVHVLSKDREEKKRTGQSFTGLASCGRIEDASILE